MLTYLLRSRFADVTHEVKPVLSGRRLVLTYNLIHITLGSKELGANSNKAMSKLRPLLSRWKEDVDEDPFLPATLAFLLEHQYTDASLCYDGLKGHDLQVAAHLREACEEHGFYFYLANLERSVEGGCDEDEYGGGGYHEIMDEIDQKTFLKRIIQIDGTDTGKDLDFDEELFIQEDPFGKEEPDDEDYSVSRVTKAFQPCTSTIVRRVHLRSSISFLEADEKYKVALIVPRKYRMDFLLSRSSNKKDYGYAYWHKTPETADGSKAIEWATGCPRNY